MESLRCHAKYQRRMFDQAVQLVRPGGVIVYSTIQRQEDPASLEFVSYQKDTRSKEWLRRVKRTSFRGSILPQNSKPWAFSSPSSIGTKDI